MPSKVLKKSKIHQLKLKVTEMVENLEGELNFFVVEADIQSIRIMLLNCNHLSK